MTQQGRERKKAQSSPVPERSIADGTPARVAGENPITRANVPTDSGRHRASGPPSVSNAPVGTGGHHFSCHEPCHDDRGLRPTNKTGAGVGLSGRGGSLSVESRERFVHHPGRPEYALEDGHHVFPEPVGVLPEVDPGTEDAESVDGAATGRRPGVTTHLRSHLPRRRSCRRHFLDPPSAPPCPIAAQGVSWRQSSASSRSRAASAPRATSSGSWISPVIASRVASPLAPARAPFRAASNRLALARVRRGQVRAAKVRVGAASLK